MVKRFYTIAEKKRQNYGHGSYGEELHICPINAYSGNPREFHPLFETHEKATEYLKKQKFFIGDVVQLKVANA